MNCKQTKELLSQDVDGRLSAELKSRADAHLGACPSCARELKELQQLVNGLHMAPQHELPPAFNTRLHQELVDIQRAKAARPSLFAWNVFNPAVASAFVMLFCVTGSVYFLRQMMQPSKVVVIDKAMLGLNEESTMKIALNTENAIDDADFEIELPPDILVSRKNVVDPAQRFIRWTGRLEQGENEVYLKVRAIKKGDYTVKVRLQKDKYVKKMEMPVSVIKI